MSWSLHRWVWLVESPLFVGAPPAGALNRCRPYVLARGIWGALTSESAQAGANGFPDYRQRGKTLRECARFTYLYPAARVNGAWRAWLPKYDKYDRDRAMGLVWLREDHTGPVPYPAARVKGAWRAWLPKYDKYDRDRAMGLVWLREDHTEPVPDRQFRRWIIAARPGTAIDPESDTAAEATLRETECVMTNWRAGSPSGSESVALVGYVFLKDMPAGDLEGTTTLFIGGDTRYGLGRLRRVEFAEADTVFGARPALDGSEPQVFSSLLLGHAISKREIYGAKEAMTGWDRTAVDPLMSVAIPRWVPGSQTREDVAWAIDPEGTWVDTDGCPPTR